MRSLRSGLGLLASIAIGLWVSEAQAVPSFARQSGMDCTACHMSWLELTNVGRRFKLGGYQLTKAIPDDAQRPLVSFNFRDPPPLIPIAGMLQLSVTHTAKTNTPGTLPAADFPLNNEAIIQQASVFLNGKLAEHVGCFCQLTYDGAAGHTSLDNFEVRVANAYTHGKFEALYGLSLNDNPTMSDVWNTTPVWGWPYAGSTVAPAPVATPIINASLANSAGGLTAYTLLARTLYLEFGGYRTTDGVLSFLHLNVPNSDRYHLDGIAPYYRAALQHDWDHGHQSIEGGTFGIDAKVYQPGAPTYGPTDRYKDTGFDAQYQYITDKHRFSAMYTYVHEKQTLDSTFANGGSSNPTNTLNFISTKVSYYYNKWYGISVGYQRTTGSSDGLLYPPYDSANPTAPAVSAVNGSVNGSPDTEAVITELNYLFSTSGAEVYRKSRIVLQYTAYSKFNGASSNYNGFGRNAKDNNTLYLLAWLMY